MRVSVRFTRALNRLEALENVQSHRDNARSSMQGARPSVALCHEISARYPPHQQWWSPGNFTAN